MSSGKRIIRACIPVAIGALVLLLSGCGAGGDEPDDWSIYTNISGLTAVGLVLQNNGAGNITVPSGTTSQLITDVAAPGSAYSITILTQPTGLVCSVANGSGTANSDINNIAITCATPATFSITASLSGVSAAGMVLQNNGAGSIAVPAGATTVPIASNVASGTAYAVTVQIPPSGLLCSVTNGSGTASGNVTNIAIACSMPYTIGGTISGYTGTGLALRLNGQTGAVYNTSPATGANNFGFTAGLATGATYAVTISAQPTPTQVCGIGSGGTGTVAAADVTNVVVNCVDIAAYTVGGTVTGLTGAGLSLSMRYTGAGAPGTVSVATASVAAGAINFGFAETIPATGVFDIGILTQPVGQTCVLRRARGASPQNVTNVAVICVNNTVSTLVGAYTALVPAPAGRLYINFHADGTFTTALTLNDATCNTATDTGNGNGVEYGAFSWNSTTNAMTLPATAVGVDASGSCGFYNGGAPLSGVTVQKGVGTITVTAGGAPLTMTGIAAPNPTTSVVGAYVPEAGNGLLLVLHADNTFVFAETQGGAGRFSTQERGCYSVAGAQITFVVDALCKPDGLDSYDFNGPYGLGPFPATPTIGPLPFTLESATVLVLNGTRWTRSVAN
jgi:hypothetical protein